MQKVLFKYPDEVYVIQKLIDAVNALCIDMGKNCTCTSGYRSLQKQITINKQKLNESSCNYQTASGAVYNAKGQCIAAAYGESNHCFCIAMDISDEWFKDLSNAKLKKYGLVKPIPYEPWHVQLIEHNGITKAQKERIRDSVLTGGDKGMDVKGFQAMEGLTADGIAGSKTKEKAREVLMCCQSILGNDFQTAEDVIKSCMTKPEDWLEKLKTIPHFQAFIMNIVNRMGGKQ